VPRRARNRVAQGWLVAAGVFVHPEIEPDLGRRIAHPVWQGRILQMHDPRAAGAGRGQQGCQPRPRFRVHGEIDPERAEQPVGLDEIALHVDHYECGMRGIDQFRDFGQDVLAFNGDHLRSLSSRMHPEPQRDGRGRRYRPLPLPYGLAIQAGVTSAARKSLSFLTPMIETVFWGTRLPGGYEIEPVIPL